MVPNAVAGAPLSGTEPLLGALETTAVGPGAETLRGSDLRAAVRFTRGAHGSFLDPGIDPAVTAEMQGLMARFLASDGTAVALVDGTVVEP